MGKSKKIKTFQDEEEEDYEEDSEEEDELSLIYRRVKQLWKKRQSNLRGSRRTGGHSESTSGLKKSGAGKDIICFECKDSCHCNNECPKLRKDRPKKKDFRGKKKGMMATWDDSEEEQANVALMENTSI